MSTVNLTALLLAAATCPALAWPFREQTVANATGLQAELQPRAIQTEPDRAPEYFCGGTGLFQLNNEPRWAQISLPLPDKDPYAANASVGWNSGRGDAGDIDNDGDTDIIYSVLVNGGGGATGLENVRILACRNNGDGTWTRLWQLKDTESSVLGAPEVRLADFDRDGDPDIVETSNGLRVMWNDGNGVFSTATAVMMAAYPTVPGLTESPEIEVADFDGNGWPDIVMAGNVRLSSGAGRWDVTGRVMLFSNTAGTFTTSTILTNPALVEFQRSATTDWNDDGRPDLLISREIPLGSELLWCRNTGNGFAAPAVITAETSSHPIVFVPGDVDDDGRVDIVISDAVDRVRYLRGNGAGGFTATATLLTGISPAAPSAITIADMDADGDNDIICRHGATLLVNSAIRAASGASTAAFSGINPTGTVDLTVGDVNNDGKKDLICADGGGRYIRWYAGNGSGLNAPVSFSTGSTGPLSAAAGDFNNDGKTDLAWTTTNSLTFALAVNGSGSSWNFTSGATMTGITAICAEDMDRDGDADILSISPSAGIIRIHNNNGTGTTWMPQNIDSGLTGLTSFNIGLPASGGRPDVYAVSSNKLNRYRYSPATGWDSIVASHNNGTSSIVRCGGVLAELNETFPGPETVFVVNDSSITYTQNTPQSDFGFGGTSYRANVIVPVDWNGDGFSDILAATANSVTLSTRTRSTQPAGAPTVLLTGVSIQDIVVIDLDGDPFPDAVAVDSTGQLHLIYNRSAAVDVQISSPGDQRIPPGTPSFNAFTAFSIVATHQGAGPAEAAAAPASLALRFRRSTPVNGVDTPGNPLTEAELGALVESMSVYDHGNPVPYLLSAAPAGIANGYYTLTIPAENQGSLRSSYGDPSRFDLRFFFKSTASSAPVTRFFVEYSPASPWVHYASFPVPGSLTGLTTLPLGGTSVTRSTLFNLDPLTPLESWRQTWFGNPAATGSGANDADPDHDGIPNLMEYVLSRNPTSTAGLNGNSAPLDVSFIDRDTPVRITLRTITAWDSKLRITIQYSTNMQSWSTLTTRTGNGAWSISPDTTTLLSGGGRTGFQFNATVIPRFTWKQFFRLKAEEIP